MTDKEIYRKAAKAAIDNAFDIFDDAEILYKHEKFSRAFTLSMLSLEELAKSFIYRCVSVELLEEKGIRTILFDHNEKLISSGHFMTLTILMLDHFDKIKKAIKHDQEFKDHKDHLYLKTLEKFGMESAREAIGTLGNAQSIKLDSIYVDVRDRKIIEPKEIIDEKKSQKILYNTHKVLVLMQPLLDSTDELFTKYVNQFLLSTVDGIKKEVETRIKNKKK